LKLDLIKESIHQYVEHPRSIWWCWHKDLAQELAKTIKEKVHKKVDLVTGSTTPAKRNKVLHEWKYGDPGDPRILVATIASMSAACNLVTAEAAYFLEYDWAPLNIAQAEKRHHRPGNKHPTVYSYYFYIPGTHEERMLNTLLEKIEQQEEILPARDNKEQVMSILNRFDGANYAAVLDSVARDIVDEHR
jgi:SNF2 family DNA or RNA helicase